MILADTSVWLRFVYGREPFLSELDRLLDKSVVAGHELVYGELLIGGLGGRLKLLAEYANIRHAQRIAHAEVVALVRTRGLPGRGIGWIDAHLLASALADRMQLWTADVRLNEIAAEFGIAHRIGG